MWRFVRAVPAIAVVCALLSLTACATREVDHAAVGEWGTRSQSGEVASVISVSPDGGIAIAREAGLSLGAFTGTWEPVDSSSIQCVDGSGSDNVFVRVAGGQLTVTIDGKETRGFTRLAPQSR